MFLLLSSFIHHILGINQQQIQLMLCLKNHRKKILTHDFLTEYFSGNSKCLFESMPLTSQSTSYFNPVNSKSVNCNQRQRSNFFILTAFLFLVLCQSCVVSKQTQFDRLSPGPFGTPPPAYVDSNLNKQSAGLDESGTKLLAPTITCPANF